MTTSVPVPPLPDLLDVLDRSQWADTYPGLRQWGHRWLAWAPGARQRVAASAAELARPRLRGGSLRAVGRSGAQAARASAPAIASGVRRRKSVDPDETRVVVRAIQDVVKAGGPTYVKLGQFVATAKGLLPDEWVEAFGWCRDAVAPMPTSVVRQRIEEAFEVPIEALFSSFDAKPLGSASIGQVHGAVLRDGTEVVVKIRRPGLRERFETDLKAMALAAGAAEKVAKSVRFANPTGFVELFAQLVLAEIDFRFEAIQQLELALASEASGHDYMGYPHPIPTLVAEDVLVMTRVAGVSYDKALAVYPDVVDGERLLRLAITGVLEHTLAFGVFHGDLHAGNVLIGPTGDFALIDFGIAGRIDAVQRAALVKFLVGFARNDFLLMMQGMQDFGAIPQRANLNRLAKEMEDRITEVAPELLARDQALTVGDMDVDMLTSVLSAIVRTMASSGFTLPKELVLFFKNLLYLNGFAATLAPDSDLLSHIEPVLTHFITRYPAEMTAILAGLTSD